MLKYNFQKHKNIVPAQAKNEHVEKTNEAKDWFLVKNKQNWQKKKIYWREDSNKIKRKKRHYD